MHHQALQGDEDYALALLVALLMPSDLPSVTTESHCLRRQPKLDLNLLLDPATTCPPTTT